MQDAFALMAAAASEKKENAKFLVDEFQSPSKFFAKMTAKELARAKEGKKKDRNFTLPSEELIPLILSSVPKKRKILMQNCIRYKRTDVLDRLVPEFKKVNYFL
jgi:hypothetical protein